MVAVTLEEKKDSIYSSAYVASFFELFFLTYILKYINSLLRIC